MKKLFQKLLMHDKWNWGVMRITPRTLLRDGITFSKATWFGEKPGRYFADPFIFTHQQQTYVFFEDFSFVRNRAHLSYVVLREKNKKITCSKRRRVLAQPFHQSYPYLFAHAGEVYCVPEEGENSAATLYRAKEFPHTWEKVTTLVENFVAIDSTVFHYNKRWWLLCTKGGGSEDRALHAFWARRLEGPWYAHKKNPLRNTLTGARPAGTPFLYGRKLYRPAQDCSKTYGGGLLINEVTTLTTEKFEERLAKRIRPQKPYPDGVHHLSLAGPYMAFDAKRYAGVFDVFLKYVSFLRALFRKILRGAILTFPVVLVALLYFLAWSHGVAVVRDAIEEIVHMEQRAHTIVYQENLDSVHVALTELKPFVAVLEERNLTASEQKVVRQINARLFDHGFYMQKTLGEYYADTTVHLSNTVKDDAMEDYFDRMQTVPTQIERFAYLSDRIAFSSLLSRQERVLFVEAYRETVQLLTEATPVQ